jgi:hypothetical protein
METLTIWILIAILGVIIYMYPALIGCKTTEGFDEQQVSIPVATVPIITKGEMTVPASIANPVTPVTPSPNSGAGPSPDLDTLLRNIEQAVKVPTHTPDLEKEAPSHYIPTEGTSVGAKAQPQESSTTKSQPSKPLKEDSAETDISGSLAQGKTFQTTIPKSSGTVYIEKKPVVKERIIEREKIVKVPRRCPPQRKCPPQQQCPDMRDYIRKDSIPCWGCKLK